MSGPALLSFLSSDPRHPRLRRRSPSQAPTLTLSLGLSWRVQDVACRFQATLRHLRKLTSSRGGVIFEPTSTLDTSAQ